MIRQEFPSKEEMEKDRKFLLEVRQVLETLKEQQKELKQSNLPKNN